MHEHVRAAIQARHVGSENGQLPVAARQELAGKLVQVIAKRPVARHDQVCMRNFGDCRNASRHILARDQSAHHQDQRTACGQPESPSLGRAGTETLEIDSVRNQCRAVAVSIPLKIVRVCAHESVAVEKPEFAPV